MAKPQNHRPLSNQVHQVHQASQARDMESTYASGGVHLDARYSPARLPYGRVVDVVGDAWVRDPVTLELRKLVAGDVIERASVVLTDQNGIIQIEPQRGPLVPIVPLRVNSVQRALPEVDPAQKVVPGSLTDAYRVDRIHESVDGNQYDLAPALIAPQGAGAQGHAGGVGVAVNSVTVNEGAGTATFTIQLDHMADGVVRVGYSTRDGDATAGVDFGGAAGVLVFQPGEVSKTITVPIFNDNVFEGAEDFRILLTPAPGAWESLLSTGVGTIMDDGSGSVPAGVMPDNDTPVVSIIGVVVNEASPFAEFRVTLSNPAKMPVTVSYASADGMAQAGADYIAVTGVITFAPGELEHVIRVPILNDDVYEGAESFSVLLSDPVNALVNVPQTTATILDDGTGPVPPGVAPDDDRPVASINDVVFNEAAGTAAFTVTLAGTATTPITIDYAAADGTAKAGLDYAATTGTLTFAPGETSKTISIPILNDNVYEGSEAFTINLSNPSSNALIADPSGLGTIKDDGTGTLPPGLTPDDDRPVVSINDVLVNEASAKATFTVTLSNASDLPVTIKYGSVNGTAEAGFDYDAVLGTLTFAPGELTKTIDVPLHNDTVYEGPESFQIVLTDPTNAKVIASGAGVDAAKDGTGIGTIKDDGTGPVSPGVTPDNDTPAASINDVVVNEAAGTATFTVTLTNAAKMPVMVDYATADGTAKAGLDYAAVASTLTFAPGETSKSISVPILNDNVYEGAETFTINLSAPINTTVADGVGLGGTNDDRTIVVGASAISLSEEGVVGGLPDSTGSPTDSTNAIFSQGVVAVTDSMGMPLTVKWDIANLPDPMLGRGAYGGIWMSYDPTLFDPAVNMTTRVEYGQPPMTSFDLGLLGNGQHIVLVSEVLKPILAVAIDDAGNYSAWLSPVYGASIYSPGVGVGAAGEDIVPISFPVIASNGVTSGFGSVSVLVEDDAPGVIPAASASVTRGATNLMLVLDTSGSMMATNILDPGLYRGLSYSNMMAISAIDLIDKYALLGDVAVRLVTFDTDASTHGDYWLTATEAKAFINGGMLSGNGNTNYDSALGAAQAAFSSTAGKLADGMNVSYFVSDGLPSQSGYEISPMEEASWIAFLSSNSIESHAFGLGSTVGLAEMNPVAWSPTAGNTDAEIVLNLNYLPTRLAGGISNVATGVLGGIGAGTLESVGVGMHVSEVQVDGVTYSWNQKSPAFVVASSGSSYAWNASERQLTVGTVAGGYFMVDFDGRNYKYSAPTAQSASSVTENVSYRVADIEGDYQNATLSIFVSPSPAGGNIAMPQINGTASADLLTGSATGADYIRGLAGADTIFGFGGDDVLLGGDGNDVVDGGMGDDWIDGSFGSDTLTGGVGSDTFHWHAPGYGVVLGTVITDFSASAQSAGGDVLNFVDLLYSRWPLDPMGNILPPTVNLEEFIDFSMVGADTEIRVDLSGDYVGGTYSAADTDVRIVLQGIDLAMALGVASTDAAIIAELLARNKLIVY